MFSYNYQYPPAPPPLQVIESNDVTIEIRQQPKEALVTSEGKEKARKPVDPPPILQVKVRPEADPQQHYLQSPYLFLCVTLWHSTKEEPIKGDGRPSLVGSLTSSIHRLKDLDNRDGGFFVFGDVSVKHQGNYRLHFTLYDLRKQAGDHGEVVFLGNVTSDIFKVLPPKDFKGMDESTYLSRAFSDQGVRLRLRKEPRAMTGANKRNFPYSHSRPADLNIPAATAMGKAGPSDSYDSMYGDAAHSPAKRHRGSGEPEEEGDHSSSWDRNPQIADRSVNGMPNQYPPQQLSIRQPHVYQEYPQMSMPPQQHYVPTLPRTTQSFNYNRMPTTGTYVTEPLPHVRERELGFQFSHPSYHANFSSTPQMRTPTTTSFDFGHEPNFDTGYHPRNDNSNSRLD